MSLWIKNGKDPKKANLKYKHAILNKEKTKELMEQKKKEGRKLPASVYDYYDKGEFIMTGTAREISQALDIDKRNIYSYVQSGKNIFDYRKTRKHAVLNEAETRKRFPLLSISSEEELIETKEKERRKHETKEERRLRRNIRAQMAIENSRKDELGL
ncbi:DUF658 family protein [Lactococcus lactis]|uniref:DUF658 family protein n=1 Tax=Lactococcus lactis TaxID=1358 RepID=UPI001FF8ED02|nr:DUF658 family protein [Lactococcus lactis]